MCNVLLERPKTFVLFLFVWTSVLLITPVSAQSVYGSIFGTVSDKTGRVIANATVTVTDENKGTVITATTNEAGDYSVPHLVPDVYDLKVAAKDFKSFETRGVKVQADTAPRIDAILEIGAITQTIEVNAETQPEMKTDRADVSTIFDQQQLSSLPIVDQNFTNLQLLMPGAQPLGFSIASSENPQGSKQIQIDGQSFGGTAFELDGTDNEDPILGLIVINPTLDSVTETKITTQNFDAELGKAVSAVISTQTKSGTNQFHGNVYDFRTSNANRARDPFTQPPGPNAIPAGLENRFGGSIGGPVVRNKLFFFFNYEALRQRVGTANTDTVPTPQLVNTCLGKEVGPMGIPGCDFSDYATQLLGSPSSQLIFDNTSDQSAATVAAFGKNVIPASLVSPQAKALLTLLAPYAPNTGGGSVTNNYAAGGTGVFNSNQWTARGDYTLNEKAHAFVRFSRFWDLLSGKVMFGAAGGPGFGIGGYGGNSKGANDSLASGMDIAINPKLLTDFRLGYYRYNIVTSKYDQGVDFANQLGIPGINTGSSFTSGAPGFVMSFPFTTTTKSFIGGGLGVNNCNCPLTEREDQFQLVNNWTKIVGNHAFKFGADLRYARNLRVPSDSDRAGQLNFLTGPTSNAGTNGLGWASFVLGDVGSFDRFVSTSTNAKEFQKRTFFYGQDSWRATPKLTLNLGLRWDLFFPEVVNGAGNGSLMNITTGYLQVAGLGGIPSNMGWTYSKAKQFAPRIGIAYQLNEKTVLRAGYGRSFDTGIFGSVFGGTVTQDLPVLTQQIVSEPGITGTAFNLSAGPPAPTPIAVPPNGLLPNPGSLVQSFSRPNPLKFPTIDAWNLSVQRAITSTLSLTAAYVGTKGTHTVGDNDAGTLNPNEAALILPGAYSVNGQTLHYDPAAAGDTINPDGGVSNPWFLQRYYGAKLAACSDPSYATPAEPFIQPGMCGWVNPIVSRADGQNSEFDALQVTLEQRFSKGLAFNLNYNWNSAFDENATYYTWNQSVTHMRDSNVRDQQLILYGSYDLPFGRGRQYAPGVNRVIDLLIGGYQLSGFMNWSGGLPFTLNYSNFGTDADPETCAQNTGPTSAPCLPNAHGHMSTKLTAFDPVSHTRSFWTPQPTSGGIFSFPGLDVIGNAGQNTYRGPAFFNTDLALTKAFTIHEDVVVKFRMDAFNVFNHINAGNPNNDDIFGKGVISSEAPGAAPRQLEFGLKLQF